MSKAKKIKLPNGSVIDLFDDGAVRFDATQSLTEAQKARARTNIGAGDIVEAPKDNKQYARKNGQWDEVALVASDHSQLSNLDYEHAGHTGFQPTINDLSTIRSGAQAGATAVQPADIANFVTKSVNDLLNYYIKAETYTKTEVQALIDAVKQFSYEVVSALPAAAASTMHKIYLVPSSDPQSQNIKDEYITIDNGSSASTRYTWEQIGSTAIDLSNYHTITEETAAINAAIAPFLTEGQIRTIITGYGYASTTKVNGIADRVSAIEDKEDAWDGKQEALVSGTNIKTINNQSLLGSGNINVGGVEEAPMNDNRYVRRNGGWVSIETPRSIVLEQSSNPVWTVDGDVKAIDRVIYGYDSIVIDEARKIYARLDPNDDYTFADGTAWNKVTGNAFRHFGKLYYAVNQGDDGKSVLYGSDLDLNLGGHSFAENFIGIWKGSVDANGRLRSIPEASAQGSKTMSQFWDEAQLNGANYGLMNYFDHQKMIAMYLLEYGNADSKSVIGRGLSDAGYSATYYNPLLGCTHALGKNSGTAVFNSSYRQVKLFGVEALWGSQWEFRPNIRFNGVTSIVYAGNVVSNSATGRQFNRDAGLNFSATYFSKVALGEYFDVIPTVGGSDSSHDWCAGAWSDSGGQLLGVGGNSAYGSGCGLAAAASDGGFSGSAAAFGARLAFKGSLDGYTEVEGAQF